MLDEASMMTLFQQWGQDDPRIRALLLTSSRVRPNARTDLFSDYDVVVVVNDLNDFLREEAWMHHFGTILARFNDTVQWPDFDLPSHMRLVLYDTGLKIDFSVWPVALLHAIVAVPKLPDGIDAGYQILLDKDALTSSLHAPSYTAYIPTPPTEAEYQRRVSEFWWETTYVAKNLWRDDLFFAKFNMEYVIRFDLLLPMLEWYVETEHNWTWQPGLLGRGLAQRLDATLWAEIETTFAGADREANWQALFNTTDLFRKLALHVAQSLQCTYPVDLDTNVTHYLAKVRGLAKDATALG